MLGTRRHFALGALATALAVAPARAADLEPAMDRFAEAYNRFVKTLNAGSMDLKQARALPALWRKVERSLGVTAGGE